MGDLPRSSAARRQILQEATREVWIVAPLECFCQCSSLSGRQPYRKGDGLVPLFLRRVSARFQYSFDESQQHRDLVTMYR